MNGAVVWLTGLPASGKTTLARHLIERLRARGREPVLLDGDQVRDALVPRPGYDPEARDRFYATLGNLAALLARGGALVVVAATAHRRRWRDAARAAAPRFVEVHVATPAAECRRRDPKHLYRDAGAALPGAGVDFEPPVAPEVVAPHGDGDEAVAAIVDALDALGA